MTGIPENKFIEDYTIAKIKDSMLSEIAKTSRIQEVKRSFSDSKDNTSIKTILTITSCLIGSATLVFPMVFHDSGLINSFLIMIIIGIICCKTCLLEIIHCNPLETDVSDIIKRIMGRKWFICYCIGAVMMGFVAALAYFLLICNMFYLFLTNVFKNYNLPEKSEFSFSQFSFQYTGIILISILFCLFNLKHLNILLKISQKGIISICFYIIYLIYQGVSNISNNNVNSSSVKIVTTDFATICGVFSFSFAIHNGIIPIMKRNKNEKNNKRDLIYGYSLTAIIYSIIGIFGTFSIAGLNKGKCAIVLDYFDQNALSATIEILLFFQLFTVMPILWYICRSQFFNMFYENETIPKKYFVLSNIIFSLICLIVQMINVDPTLVISLNGAIVGYFLVYFIPIKIHLQCLYSEKTQIYDGLIENYQYEEKIEIKTEDKTTFFENSKIEKEETVVKSFKNQNNCGSSHMDRKSKIPRLVRFTIYIAILLLGLAIAIMKIITL